MNHNYKKLNIWTRSMILAKLVYQEAEKLPSTEKFGLINQMRRSAVSIPSNIAEGCGRNTEAQTSYFINIAIGSICELETQLLLSQDLGYIPKDISFNLLNELIEIKSMTLIFMKTLKN